MGVSPMTELANNLCDTSLGITPILDSKVSSSASLVLLINGGFWNGCVTERCLHRAFTYVSQAPDADRSTFCLFGFFVST
jgi:hypothetical protein